VVDCVEALLATLGVLDLLLELLLLELTRELLLALLALLLVLLSLLLLLFDRLLLLLPLRELLFLLLRLALLRDEPPLREDDEPPKHASSHFAWPMYPFWNGPSLARSPISGGLPSAWKGGSYISPVGN
jgi:hypothetical protein